MCVTMVMHVCNHGDGCVSPWWYLCVTLVMDMCYPGDVHTCMSPWQCKDIDIHMHVMIEHTYGNWLVKLIMITMWKCIFIYLFTYFCNQGAIIQSTAHTFISAWLALISLLRRIGRSILYNSKSWKHNFSMTYSMYVHISSLHTHVKLILWILYVHKV